jgi:histidinol phosphatase-like PHP family hydrolase
LTAATAPERLLGRQDLHAHTTMSDGTLPLAEVARLAAERGVAVGIADHVSTRNPRMFVSDEAETRAYVAALEGAPVFRSAEFCWCDTLWADLPDEVMARFDYRLGSNHGFHLPDGGIASPWWERLPAHWAAAPQQLMEIMAANLCDMVRAMPIEIAAHATLLPPALRALEDDVHAWWTPPREDRFVEALADSGVALEISNRYRLPHDRLLRKALEAGVRFSLGSDGHHAHQVARLEWAVETARRVGIGDRDLFAPQRRI